MKATVLDLFAGIGGFSLGLERTGHFKTVAFCEIDRHCQDVLKKHWPEVPCHEDITQLEAWHVGAVDVICGGFPCQDISNAGKREGLTGESSGLWQEQYRLISDLRPMGAVVENVAALLGRGMAEVIGDFAEIGYDCEWHTVPASALGAPHRRDRVWLIAYPDRESLRVERRRIESGTDEAFASQYGDQQLMADTDSGRFAIERFEEHGEIECAPGSVTDGCGTWRLRDWTTCADARRELLEGWSSKASINGPGLRRHAGWWAVESELGRVADGVPRRVDRLRYLGNAIVPQMATIIGDAIWSAKLKDRLQ